MQHIIGISSRRLRISALALLLPAMSWASDTASVAVGPQYDTTHVYVERGKMDAFVDSILKTFGGTSTERVLVNVTPTPSETYSQLILTPAGSFSVFDFKTPIPHPFGAERNGFWSGIWTPPSGKPRPPAPMCRSNPSTIRLAATR